MITNLFQALTATIHCALNHRDNRQFMENLNWELGLLSDRHNGKAPLLLHLLYMCMLLKTGALSHLNHKLKMYRKILIHSGR